MASETLNSYTTSGIALSGTGAYTAPFTVTAAGTIKTGGQYAVYSSLAAPFLLNAGTIINTGSGVDFGVFLTEGGTIQNAAGAVIRGGLDAVLIEGAAGTITNAGTISTSNHFGVQLGAGGTITNTGTIAGGFGAVEILGTGGDRVVAGNGAVFIGTVSAAGTLNTLEFAGAGGTVASIGTQFTGFQTIAFDQGAAWTISGSAAALTALATITGVALGDEIDFTGFAAASASSTGTGLVLSNATASETLNVSGYGDFAITGDGHGGTDILGQVQTLGTTNTSGITLTANGAYRSPFAVTPTGAINASGAQAVYSALAAPVLFNEGQIIDTASNANGVFLKNGGTVENSAGAVIQGELDGIFFLDGPGTVSNAGSISGIQTDGVVLFAGGTVLNTGGITGALNGVFLEDGGTVTNTGSISGANGVYIYGAAGSVSNAGTITGTGSTGFGVWLEDGGTVINTGTIAGATAVYIEAASGARVVAENGAAFTGVVKASGAGSTLEFSGNGSALVSFSGFQTIAFDPGAGWGIEADATQLAALTTITGHPGLIDLTGFAATVASYTAGVGLVLSNATSSTTLHVGAGAGYRISGDGNGGTDIRLPYFITASTVGLTATPFNEFYVTGTGVTVTDATVDSQGLLIVGSGGTLTNANIVSGGTQASYFGITSNAAVYGKQIVDGGTVTNSTLHSGGVQNISGGTVTNSGLGGYQYVFGGVLIDNGYVAGQLIYGGTVTNNAGGHVGGQDVFGGTVTNDGYLHAQYVKGGRATNNGNEDYQIISGGRITNIGNILGKQTIYDGTTDNEGIVFSAVVRGGTVTGNFEVNKLLTVYGGTVTGNFEVQQTLTVYGGTVQNPTISSGGTLYLKPPLGATATVQNVLMTNGYQNNYGGVVIGTTMTGGTQFLHARYLRQFINDTYTGVITLGTGVAINSTLTNVYQRLGGILFNKTTAGHNGSQYAYSYGAGKAINTVLNGGKQSVGTNIYKDIHPADVSGTFTIDASGYALNTTINSGTQIVHLAGTVINTVLNNGTQNVDGGVVLGTTLNNSTQILSYGNIYYPIEVNGNFRTFVGAVLTDTVINSGSKQELSLIGPLGLNASGRAALNSLTNTTINNGGVQYVGAPLGSFAGGHIGEITNFNTVYTGGKQYVRGGTTGEDNGGFSSNTTLSGGAQYVGGLGTGTAAITAVFNGGVQVVGSGGTAVDTTLFAGGLAQVTSGGTIAGATIDGGTLQLEQGATLGAGGTIFEPAYYQFNEAVGELIAVPDGTYSGGITFSADGAGGLLELTAGASIVLDAPIYGFTFGDTIDLAGFTATSDMFVPGTGLTLSDGTTTQTLDIAGSFTGDTFALGTNANGSVITLEQEAACFVRGTRILTASGALVPVEELREGDEVEVFSGESARILWIGRRTLAPRRHKRPETVQPILITAGALGYGVPWRDLLLSPDHALYLEHHLIPAKTLINGFTIRQLDRETVTYYHIELPEHAALFAEGAAAESYLETGNRGAFENGGGAMTLHPDFAQTQREQESFAPFTEDGPLVEGIRRRILDRANIATTHDPALTIEYRDGCAIIRSRHAIPGLITPDPRDRRRLGVKIAGITIGGRNIPFDHPALADGWHDAEPDGRWTDGNAIIPAEILGGARDVTLHLAATLIYPITPPARESVSRQESR